MALGRSVLQLLRLGKHKEACLVHHCLVQQQLVAIRLTLQHQAHQGHVGLMLCAGGKAKHAGLRHPQDAGGPAISHGHHHWRRLPRAPHPLGCGAGEDAEGAARVQRDALEQIAPPGGGDKHHTRPCLMFNNEVQRELLVAPQHLQLVHALLPDVLDVSE